MIQQINNNKSDKQLIKSDMGRIAFASAMNFFHGQSIFDPWPFGVYYVLDCFWVKRIDSDTYQYQESWGSTYGTTTDPNKIGSYYSVSTIDANKVKSIHPNLICNTNGEERLLVECVYKKKNPFYSKNKLGFFILEPQWMKSTDGSTISIFVYHTIITPKPGLFPVK